MSTKIHPTAVIHPTAKIDEGVEIGPYAVIGQDVTIGAGTYVGPHSVIEFSEIGRNNNFYASVFIGTPPQDYSYKGEKTKVVIGDGNIIREGVSIHRGSPATSLTSVGNNCMLMAYAHIGHDCRLGSNIIMVNYAGLAGHTHVDDRAVISGHVGVHQFSRIGTMVMIGGGAMVALDVPPYCRAQGDRAKLVGLNLVGMRRNGVSRESIKSVKEAYKTMFLSKMLLKDAIAKLKSGPLSPEALKMVEFCESGKRGIMRARMASGKDSGMSESDE